MSPGGGTVKGGADGHLPYLILVVRKSCLRSFSRTGTCRTISINIGALTSVVAEHGLLEDVIWN